MKEKNEMRKLKCPYCGVKYKPSKCTLEVSGFQLRGLDCLKCPKCGDEIFPSEQMEIVQHKIKEAQAFLYRNISKFVRL